MDYSRTRESIIQELLFRPDIRPFRMLTYPGVTHLQGVNPYSVPGTGTQREHMVPISALLGLIPGAGQTVQK